MDFTFTRKTHRLLIMESMEGFVGLGALMLALFSWILHSNNRLEFRLSQRIERLESRMDVKIGILKDTIDDLESKVDAKFLEVDSCFKQVDLRFQQIDERFQQIDERFQQIDERFQQIDERFQQIDERFQQVDARFEQVSARFEQIESRLASVEHGLAQVKGLLQGFFLKFADEIPDLEVSPQNRQTA